MNVSDPSGDVPPQQYVVAIDNGTQSVRALLFDFKGNLIAKGKQDIKPYFSEQPGWAEQHADYYWESLGQACQQLWAALPVDFDRRTIAAVSLTTQRGTSICLDDNGQPLRPAMVWLDQRYADLSKSVLGRWMWLLKWIRIDGFIEKMLGKCHALWIAQNQPEIWARTRRFVFLSGYLTFKLTGEYVDSTGSQVGVVPFDYKRKRWAGKHDLLHKILPVFRLDMFPALKEPGQTLGHLSASAASFTGLPAGLPLIAAASDKACEVLGSGGNRPDIACMSYGTTATVNTSNRQYVEPTPLMPAFAAAIPDQYCSEIMIYRGFWMVSWFKREFGQREQRLAAERGIEPEQLFDELVNAVPAGSMGLMLQPLWSPGSSGPGPEAKGGIIGFGDVHTRSHMYRAILEGLAYGLKEGLETLERRNRKPVTTLRVSGGGSQSDAAMQLTADIFGLPAERPHTYETSGLGAAMTAAVGLGIYRDFDEAITHMTRVGDVFEPDPERVVLYGRLYREVYLKMYRQLRPLYRSIREITGYPKPSR